MGIFRGRINRKQYLVGAVLTAVINSMALFGLVWRHPEYFMLGDLTSYQPIEFILGIIIGLIIFALLVGMSGGTSYVLFILVQEINIFSSFTLALSVMGIFLAFFLALSSVSSRMRDLGRPPSWIAAVVVFACIPVVGSFVWWALLVPKGNTGVNRYGLPNTAGVFGKPKNGKE